jgi:hypothetical protein
MTSIIPPLYFKFDANSSIKARRGKQKIPGKHGTFPLDFFMQVIK